MRAAIYARYSSDRQSERSIEDQIAVCRERAISDGMEVVEIYTDAAISGAYISNRPGLQKLLSDAKNGRFDVVIAEALDRLSRSQKDTAGIHEEFEFLGVQLITLSEGRVDELHIGFKGTINAVFLRELKMKIRRGMKGRVRDGLSGGGLAYGYRVVHQFDDRGNPIRGLREPDETEASVVRRIFDEYVQGKSPRAIARDLNHDGIPGPKGGQWNASTINGNKTRRNGILLNEAYIGFLVWNRTTMVKNPSTGKRVHRINPSDQWEVAEVPEWRIIDDETWSKAQALKARAGSQHASKQQRPKRPLSGLLYCGECGGAYTVTGPNRLGCSAHREKGTCKNGRTVRIDALEDHVFDGLKKQLMKPERMEEMVRQVHAKIKDHSKRAASRSREINKALAAADAKKHKLIKAIEDGLYDQELKRTYQAIMAEEHRLNDELETLAEPPTVQMIPNLPEVYAAKIADLQEALNRDDARQTATNILRSIFAKVVIHPGEKRGEFSTEIHTLLPGVLGLADIPDSGEPGFMDLVVAEEGFEPPTHGL